MPLVFVRKVRGFTLIELLVVIAIIGLFTTIVVVAVQSVRYKSKDARIMTDVRQIRTIAESISKDYNSYTNLCAGGILNGGTAVPYGNQLITIQNDIATQQGGLSLNCYANATSFCIDADLKSSGMGRFCIDGQGRATTTGETSLCTAATECK